MSQPIKNDRPGRWMTFVLCAFILFGATIFYLARSAWAEVLYRLLTDGGIAVLWLLAATGIGLMILRAGRISSDSKALVFATSSALGLGSLSILVLLLGLCGWMSHGVAIGVILVGLICGFVVVRASNFKFEICDFKSSYWIWLIVVPIVAVAIVAALEPPGLLWGDEPHGYDVVEYHLQIPREWYELGRIVPLKHNVFSYFPFNVEMHYLLAMHLRGGPWAGMYLAQLMHVIFIAMTIVALVGIAKPLAAIVAATVPWMTMLAGVAYDEGGLLLFGTLAVGWMLRSDGKIRNAMLAGAMAGFACGSKLTAVPTVLLAIPFVWVIYSYSLSLRERAGVRGHGESETSGTRNSPHPNPLPVGEGIRSAIAFIISGLIVFSPWMIRNMAWTGNPVFPEAITLLGKSHFTDIQVERWQLAHTAKPEQRDIGSRIAAAVNQIGLQWRYGYSVLLLLALIAAAMNRSRASAFLIPLLLIQFIFWIGFTHLQGRFFVLGIPIAAMLLPMTTAKWWRCSLVAGSIINACVAMIVLSPRVARYSAGIGAERIQSLLPEHITAALTGDKPIVLAGDARAFLYQIPMSRLTYRTVFDVDVASSPTIVDAWIKGAPDNATMIIDSNELERFSKTYWNISPMPRLQEISILNGRTWITVN